MEGLPQDFSSNEAIAEQGGDSKWRQIQEKIDYCRSMIDNCDSAVIVIDHSYDLVVRPRSPIAFEDNSLDGQQNQTIKKEFRVVEASMFLKHGGELVEPLMVGSSRASGTAGAKAAAKQQNLRVYYFNPYEHEITINRTRQPESQSVRGSGVKLMSAGQQVQFVIY